MSRPLEDYAIVGDSRTAALIARDGTIDWLCLPAFDSGACFAALLGDDENGSWSLAPAVPARSVSRAYRDGSMVLETTYDAEGGRVRVTDAMVTGTDSPRLVRCVEGLEGRVAMRSRLRIRFDYGRIVPWVHRTKHGIAAVAGPDALALFADVEQRGEDHSTVAEFEVGARDQVCFEIAYYRSYDAFPRRSPARHALRRSDEGWRRWAERCRFKGRDRELVVRSLLTLKALADTRTGAVLAAPTTSLPEVLGGVRNWDYRYCWLRDATFVLVALLNAGYEDEARAWRAWLLRAVAANPGDIQILYSLRGARHVPEYEAPWLAGYGGAKPVRIGNAAVAQLQLDVYGEVVDVMHQAHRSGIGSNQDEWNLMKAVVETVEHRWSEDDCGLWEVRSACRPFVHSKVLAWVALDRAIAAVEQFRFDGPVDRWRALRAEIHEQVCREGYDARRETFTQSYGSRELDAATLLIPLVGFLPHDDPRVRGTIRAVERELLVDGFVRRYTHHGTATDGLPPGEGAFFACGFWLADNYTLQGRWDDARALFDRQAGVANDVGLLSEEYDVGAKRMVGNFPQAFSHVGLVNSAFNLAHDAKTAHQRRR
ncbi:MAG TPA: glycoside hydrolase family 15 protein [Candidatus Elarobacter sp.]